MARYAILLWNRSKHHPEEFQQLTRTFYTLSRIWRKPDPLALSSLQQIETSSTTTKRQWWSRTTCATTLRQRGAIVDECECYQRLFIDYVSEEFALKWKNAQVDTFVVTSGEMLQQLFYLVAGSEKAWLLNSHLVVVSKRLATIASTLGFKNNRC